MAIQAQYPSNVLLLDRAVREGKSPIGEDYSLQPQPGGRGIFTDQSQMMFNNGVGANPRKRARELNGTTSSVNPFSMQTQPLQLIDVSQLHTPVTTGLQLAFGEQQRQQQQYQSQQQQQRQRQNQIISQPSVLASLLSEDLGSQIRQQRNEIEQFLQAQGEQLRRTLADKRQRHYRALLGAAEETLARRLKEKEAEVEKAARRNAELEARASQLSAEAQAWQARARAQEATAASLQEQLRLAMIGGGALAPERGEEPGCGGGEAEDAESAYIDPAAPCPASGPSCKVCQSRPAAVVVLPCRHLCLCTECAGVAHNCPLCWSFKESSIEVFLS
ncbi:hypothetical protein NMG60_11030182 [Bertholletia excelsa]